MCQIFITVWVQKGRVGFTTYNNEPIQDFGPKFRGGGGCYAGLWAAIQREVHAGLWAEIFFGGGRMLRSVRLLVTLRYM